MNTASPIESLTKEQGAEQGDGRREAQGLAQVPPDLLGFVFEALEVISHGFTIKTQRPGRVGRNLESLA